MRPIRLMKSHELFQSIEQLFPLRAKGLNHLGREQGFVRFSNSVIGIAQQKEGIGIRVSRFFQILDGVWPPLLLISDSAHSYQVKIGGVTTLDITIPPTAGAQK